MPPPASPHHPPDSPVGWFADEVHAVAVPVIIEMPPLAWIGGNIGPEETGAFAAWMSHARIGDAVGAMGAKRAAQRLWCSVVDESAKEQIGVVDFRQWP